MIVQLIVVLVASAAMLYVAYTTNKSTKTVLGEQYKAPPPSNTSPQEKADFLDSQGQQAMKYLSLKVAIEKFEEAHNLAPNNLSIAADLGYTYGFAGSTCSVMGNTNGALPYYEKSVALLEHANDRKTLAEVLAFYSVSLKAAGKNDEATKVEERMHQLEPQTSIDELIQRAWHRF